MPGVSGFVDAPFQGISQAATSLRLPAQATSLVDCIVEPEKGFRKRPPALYLGKVISDGSLTVNARQKIITDPDDGSLVLLNLDTAAGVTTAKLIKLTDLTSPAVSISGAANTYLNSGGPLPQGDLRVLAASDTNFITNRKMATALSGSSSTARPAEALIWVKEGGFGWTFNITITGSFAGSPITGAITTPDGGDSSNSLWVYTNKVASALLTGTYTTDNHGAVTAIGAALTGAGFTYSVNNSVIYLTHASATFSITSNDAQGGAAFSAIKGSVPTFDSLPRLGPPNGMVMKIQPINETDSAGAFYVQYDLANTVWKECLAPGTNLGIDTTTLPVALIKTAGNWGIAAVAWKARQVGDATIGPDPGLVGSNLSDMCYYDGRLGLVYHEGCLFCAADDPFRLYPATVVTEIDSDPFEFLNPDNERSLWEWATPMYGGMVFVGRRSQTFVQNADAGSFTAKAIQKRVVARYQLDTVVSGATVTASGLEAVASNDRIYLATPRANAYLGFFEFAADRLSGRILPDDISAHVPTLLPSGLDRVASVEPQFALLYGASGGTSLYLGLFRYANYQRVQTAWFQWKIHAGFTLAGLVAHGTVYYLLLRDASGNGHLVSINLDPEFFDLDTGSTILTKLDLRVASTKCTVAFSDTTGNTTITPPMPVDATTAVSAAGNLGQYTEGYLGQVVSYSATQVVLRGDWTGQHFYLGYQYSGVWGLSTIYRRSQDNRPITRARLTVNDILLDVTDAVNLYATVAQQLRPSRAYLKAAHQFGPPPNQYTGQWRFPVNGRNTRVTMTIEDRSHIGGKVSGFEWFGHQEPFFQRTT